MRRLRSIVPGLPALAALGFVLVLASCYEDKTKANALPAEPAPGFVLPVLGADADSQVDFDSLAGKTVILDFWATWCVPCEFQVPELNAFHEAHRADSDVALFGLSVDTEGVDVIAAWTEEKGVRYPILLADDELAREFGVDGFPTVVIIRSDGTIDSRHTGLIQQSELEEILTRLRGAV